MTRRRTRSARIARWGLPAALVLLLAGWFLAGRGSSEDAGPWAEVKRDDLVLGVEVTGVLRAIDTEQLGPPHLNEIWEYKISRLAAEGSEVKAGADVLAFDTSVLERELEEKRAERAAAVKEIEKREIDLAIQRRDQQLQLAEAEARRRRAALKVDRPGELASAHELRQSRLDLELAEREIAYLAARIDSDRRSAEAELASLGETRDRAAQRVREIEDAISRMTVKAPRDGTVIYISNWRDEKKKVGDSCWQRDKVLEIPDLARMKGEGEVDEADAGKVRVGQSVSIRLDAHADVEFTGRVKSIWGTVQKKSWNNPLKIVRLEIELDHTDRMRMRPGMRFRGRVETGRIERALVVPGGAVFPTPEGPVAFRKTPFGVETVPLEVGARASERVEVVRGLDEGERVSLRDPRARGGRT